MIGIDDRSGGRSARRAALDAGEQGIDTIPGLKIRNLISGPAGYENFEASFIASASFPILAIQRSTSSWFSRCSRLDLSSAILSCRFSVASSSWKSYTVISLAAWMGTPNQRSIGNHTSNNLAFPFSSSSRSFTRSCSCILWPSKILIRRASCVFFFRSLSKSALTWFSLSCNSERERWASERSARVAARVSCNDGPGSPSGCFLARLA